MPNTNLPLDDIAAQAVTRLEVLEVEDYRVVVLNGHQVAQYRRDDQLVERVMMTQLAEVSPLKDRDIAKAFGIHPVSLSRFCGQARQQGGGALVPKRPGPRGPNKLTVQLKRKIVHLGQRGGLSTREIAKRVSKGDVRISHMTVARVLNENAPESEPLPWPSTDKEPERQAEGYLGEDLQPGQTRTSRYAGALMLFAALGQLDLWGVLHRLGAQVGPSRWFGMMPTIAAIVFCFALRFRSIEDFKNVGRQDFGVLLGTRQGPSVQTLRLKLQQITESLEPVLLNRELLKRYLELEPVWEGMYYVDGHFCPYYGHYSTPKGWNPHRRLAAPGYTDIYIHDIHGRALFFVSQPLNDSLVRAMPGVVEEIRRVHGANPFTVVFDRGGYSGELFRWLTEENIGFISYLKGRKARRRYPEGRFEKSWYEFEKVRQVYRVYEKKTQINKAGLIRTVVYRDDSGEQIPILSNLSAKYKPAKIIHCLRMRWRQENALKYLKEHYAIEQMIQYGAEEEQNEHRVANPKRKKLNRRIKETQKDIEELEAQLGRAVENSVGKTTTGLKIAQAPLRRELESKRQVLNRLQTRLGHTPSVIAITELEGGEPRELLKQDRRLIVNTLKMVAYNAERLLAMKFNGHYKQDKDVFSIFRSLFHLPGKVVYVSKERVEVRLERPRPEKSAKALELLCEDLNSQEPRLFTSGPILNFGVSN